MEMQWQYPMMEELFSVEEVLTMTVHLGKILSSMLTIPGLEKSSTLTSCQAEWIRVVLFNPPMVVYL